MGSTAGGKIIPDNIRSGQRVALFIQHFNLKLLILIGRHFFFAVTGQSLTLSAPTRVIPVTLPAIVFPTKRLWFELPDSMRMPEGPGISTSFPGFAPALIIAGEGRPREGEEKTFAEIVQKDASSSEM